MTAFRIVRGSQLLLRFALLWACPLVAQFTVTSSQPVDAAGTTVKQSTTYLDGMGRTVRTVLNSDPSGSDTVTIGYDGNGNVFAKSNPQRSLPSPTDGTTFYTYDVLGRPVLVTAPDNGTLTTANTPIASYSYSGPCTTVTDQAGKSSTSCVDALGRIAKVVEDPNGLKYETDYTYDALGNLVKVVQNGEDSNQARVRQFTYDSSRLKTAQNPESGTISYTYDATGNLLTKTDARNITISYTYDALNRLINNAYSNADASVTYSYDQGANGIGRRTGMSDSSGSTGWTYDQMGRVLSVQKTLSGSVLPAGKAISVSTSYLYWADGSLKQITYPSGRVVQYHTNAAGQADFVYKVDPGSGQTIRYAQVTQFTPAGSPQEIIMGSVDACSNGALGEFNYNGRLQLSNLLYTTNTVSASAQQEVQSASCVNGTGDLMHRVYTFQDSLGSTSGNNGNIGTVVNCLDTNRTQNFTYDSLNRIQTAWTPNWGQQFTIDSWGNLNGVAPYKQGNSVLLNSASSAKNQQVGFAYDSSGNQTSTTDPFGSTHRYKYDAEGRMTNVDGANIVYVYDGDGNRALKNLGGTGTAYWSGANGEALAESDLNGNLTAEYVYFNGKRIARTDNPSSKSEASLKYYLQDHLGSTSMVVDASFSTVLEDTDYYPYGGQVVQNGADSNHYWFTGKERDSETNLDYFGARYYASNMGRWMSPDWSDEPDTVPYAEFENPQSLNLYSYVKNNPLVNTDADGHLTCDADKWDDATNTLTGGACHYDPSDIAFLYKTTFNLMSNAAQQVSDYITAPRNPGCMAAAMATGASIGAVGGGIVGGVAGGAGGTLVAPGVGTIGGGAVGAVEGTQDGAMAGAAVGGIYGFVTCASGSGGSKFGSNKQQNKDARDARRAAERETGKKFTPALERKFHDAISKQGIDNYHELVEIAVNVLKGY